MKATKNQSDKRKKEKNKGPGNPNWGDQRVESKLIEKYASGS